MPGLVWFAVGGVSLLLGFIFWQGYRNTKKKLALMSGVPTSSAVSVSDRSTGELVEVKGTLRCKAPLTSELGQQLCAYYTAEISRDYLVQERDAKGQYHSSQKTATVASVARSAPFFVEDESGRVSVNADGAEVDAAEIVNRYERGGGGPGITITLGDTTVDTGSYHDTIGYRYKESILAPDAPIYVLGVVQADGSIGAPPDGVDDQKFLISPKSEEELSRSLSQNAFWTMVGSIVLFVGGVLLIGIGVLVQWF